MTKYKAFDDRFEMGGLFLHFSKTFDKVSGNGIIFKLKQNGVSGKLLSLLSDFLKDRRQRVTLNGHVPLWADKKTRVPQVSILGPLLFFVCVNDPTDGLSSNAKKSADDTSLFSVIHDVETSGDELNNDLHQITKWAFQLKMSLNPDPSKQAHEILSY